MYKLCDFSKIEFEECGKGMKRKVMSYAEDLMVVYVHFDKGAIGSLHIHPHTQITHILNGKFKYIIKEEEFYMTTGDNICVPGNVEHGVECLEEGEILDIFSPYRKEFISKEIVKWSK